MNRERRIDIIRGIAIVTILLNHFAMAFRAVGYDGVQVLTPTQLGYSSAASIFVALSGYMVGMVYMRRANPIRAVVRRAVQLYFINFAVFVLVSPFALLADPARDRFWYMQHLLADPLDGTLRFLALIDAPAFLDVLQLYVALLAMTPLAILLVRRSPWLLAGCSLGLWAAIQLWPFVLPASLPVPIIGRTLNALAWQMAFFLPMIAGMRRLHEPALAWFARHPGAVAAIIGLLVAAGFAHDMDLRLTDWPVHLALTSRPVHGPVWSLHALLLLCAYGGVLALATPWLSAKPFQLLESLGRNSLNVYVASIPLIFALAFAVGWMRIDLAGYLAGTLLLLVLSSAVAAWGDARKHRERERLAQAVVQPA